MARGVMVTAETKEDAERQVLQESAVSNKLPAHSLPFASGLRTSLLPEDQSPGAREAPPLRRKLLNEEAAIPGL